MFSMFRGFTVTTVLALSVAVLVVVPPTQPVADDLAEEIANADPRNEGVDFDIETGLWNSDIGMNIEDVSLNKSMADVQRILFLTLERVSDRDFSRFYLLYEGDKRFYLEGGKARTIGQDYSWQNPIALIREFLPALRDMDDRKTYPRLNPSLLGGTMEAMENMKRFHMEWYLQEELAESD